MTPDTELLRQYAHADSEEAFAELVRRHVNLVYSAALRQVGGDAHLAQDVAQTVFTDLARKADSLLRRESLSGWLYTGAHFAAAKIVRGEHRRRDREEQFMREPIHDTASEADWEKLRPALDAVMHELKETDREAVLLRYFENRAFAEVGAKLGVNENTARMRVERAVEKLRALLAKRGITTGVTLASVISANAVQTAPGHLVASLTVASLTSAGTGALTFFQIMNGTKLKLGLGAVVTAGAIVALVAQHQAQKALRAENQSLAAEIAQLKSDNEDLSNRISAVGKPTQLADDQQVELLKLRAEVTRLRAIKNPPVVATSPATNNLPVAKKTEIDLRVRFVSTPAENMPSLRAGWTATGPDTSVLSEQQFGLFLKALQTNEALLNEGQITTLSGREAVIQLVEAVSVGGTNVNIGAMLDVLPYFSPDSSIFTLNLGAQMNLLTGDRSQPGVQTIQTSNQVTLFPGQTVAMERDIPSSGWLPSSPDELIRPGKLLVFVTPIIVDGQGNPRTPGKDVTFDTAPMKLSDAHQESSR